MGYRENIFVYLQSLGPYKQILLKAWDLGLRVSLGMEMYNCIESDRTLGRFI